MLCASMREEIDFVQNARRRGSWEVSESAVVYGWWGTCDATWEQVKVLMTCHQLFDIEAGTQERARWHHALKQGSPSFTSNAALALFFCSLFASLSFAGPAALSDVPLSF